MMRRLLATLGLFVTLAVSDFAGAQNSFDRFIMVVPVYRELYNQNIGTMLQALYDQQLNSTSLEKIDVWFIVNNTQDVSPDVKIENQETVAFLEALADGKRPIVNARHRILKQASRLPLLEKMNIHVIDRTDPGYVSRNIGLVRDEAVRNAVGAYINLDIDRTLIAHMDADSVIEPSYVRSLIEVFELHDLKFALLDMSYTEQIDSEAKVFQRKIVSDYQIAAHSFRMASDGGMPVGGTPRIVSTARALLQVGGVPHEVVGEDTQLIANLKAKFPSGGMFVDIPVYTKYRAREDGYDAAIYLEQLSRPVRFTEWMHQTTDLLVKSEAWLKHRPAAYQLYLEARDQHLQMHRDATRRLKKIVTNLVLDSSRGVKLEKPSEIYPALMENDWFPEFIQMEVKRGATHQGINAKLAGQFPYYFSEPPPKEIGIIARLKGATQAYLNLATLKNPRKLQQHLPFYFETYPKTAVFIVEEMIREIETRWRRINRMNRSSAQAYEILLKRIERLRMVPGADDGKRFQRVDRLTGRQRTCGSLFTGRSA